VAGQSFSKVPVGVNTPLYVDAVGVDEANARSSGRSRCVRLAWCKPRGKRRDV